MQDESGLRQFELDFPDDDACLEWLKRQMFPDGIYCEPCGKVTKHHRVRSRRSYSCDRCGHHVHPTAGTIYHRSRTPLTKWFYATYLLASVDPGLPVVELQRELGVTYKTAWRMARLIRSMLSEEESGAADGREPGDGRGVDATALPRARVRPNAQPEPARRGGLMGRVRRRRR